MINVNLLPKARRSALVTRTRVRRWLVGGSAYAGAVVLAGLAFTLSGPRVAVATDLFQRQQRELDDRQARVKHLETQAESLTRKLDRLARIENHPDVSALVRLIAGAQQDRIVLDSIALERTVQQPKDTGRKKLGADAKAADTAPQSTIVTYTIDVAGLARQQPDVTSFVLRLEETGLFDKVTVVESGKRDVQGAELAQFRLRCRVDEPPSSGASPAAGGSK